MNNPNWRLLGFDARETERDCETNPLPEEVRETLLLRPEIRCPFSVDRHIWPTRFQYHPRVRPSLSGTNPPLIPVDPDCDGDLWLSLGRMKNRITESGQTVVLIAVELLAPQDVTVEQFPSPLIYSTTEPKIVPDSAGLLGLDIASAGLAWSGLSNCGYSVEERARLRPEWQGRINDFGLLRSEEDALVFKEITNTRVPEHAPFWVYRLYRLPEVD